MTRALVFALCLVTAPLSALGAQRPQWDVWRTSVDQLGPWELRGPRLGIEAIRAAGGAAGYDVLRAAHVPPAVAAPVSALALGVAPHVLGLARHAYPLDLGDALADAWITGGAAYVRRTFERHHDARPRVRALLVYVAGWALAAGWASP